MASYYNFKVTPYRWHRVGSLYQVDDRFDITLDDGTHVYRITILPGFRTDGGSIPKVFSWFVKGWSDDYIYNACFVLHDALYCTAYVTRYIADDMLRSALRDVGLNRFRASTVCFCVNNFASAHYGTENDENDNYDFVKYAVTVKHGAN